jgi:hypothetical protein
MAHRSGVTRRDLLRGSAAAAAGTTLALVSESPRAARAAAADDIEVLNALITAENQAVEAYAAGAGILEQQANDPADPLRDLAPAVRAVAVHFQQQHIDHGRALSELVTAAGGMPSTTGGWTAPPGLVPSVLNIIKLAANAEKAAAIAYTNAQTSLTADTSAKVAAAIGANETQHFVVLYSLAKGLVVAGNIPDPTEVVPRAFAVDVGGAANLRGLADVPDFPVNA